MVATPFNGLRQFAGASARGLPRIVLLALLLCAPPRATAQITLPVSSTTAPDSPVLVGVYDNPPLVFRDVAGHWQGIYVDILQHVAALEGWSLVWQPCAWTDCLTQVTDGDLDLLVAIAYTEERAERMALGEQTVLANWGQVYARPQLRPESLLDLANLRLVGVVQDTHWLALSTTLARLGVPFAALEVPDYADVLLALEEGRGDAGVVSRIYGEIAAEQYEVRRTPVIINPISLRFAAPEGDPRGLLAALDRHLESFKAQERSIYHQSLSRHLPAAVVVLPPRWLLPAAIAAGAAVLLAAWIVAALAMQARKRAVELARSAQALQHETARREEAQRTLAESQARYRLIFEHLSDVVCVMDRNLRIRDISPSVQALLGYTPEELIGHSVEELLPREELARAAEHTRRVLADLPRSASVYALIASDGSIRHAEISAMRLPPGEAEDAIVLVARDITARLEAEEQLRQTQAQLVQAHKMESIALLASGVAHDFNNMLTAILGHIDLALLGADEGTPLQDDLLEARRSVERASTLTRQLLLFGHQQPLEMAPLDLDQLVQDMLKMLRRLIGEHIRIVSQVDAGVPRIWGDPSRLQQVLMNLCLNARDAMPQGGTLTIQVDEVTLLEEDVPRLPHARPGRYVRLSVSDTGVGMTPEVRERIFEPFFTTKPPGHGTGLGLSVAYAVVRDHDGWINVNSQPGQGSTFCVYLPALQAAESVGGERQSATHEGLAALQGHGERILLVEDDAEVRRFALAALSSNGYEVHVAGALREAVRLAEERLSGFDLLVSDVILPDGTGMDLARELRRRWPDVAVLLASGYADHRAHWAAIQGEGYPFIQKPYGLRQLLEAVHRGLRGAAP